MKTNIHPELDNVTCAYWSSPSLTTEFGLCLTPQCCLFGYHEHQYPELDNVTYEYCGSPSLTTELGLCVTSDIGMNGSYDYRVSVEQCVNILASRHMRRTWLVVKY